MRHPFDNLQANETPTRRAALERIAAVAASALGLGAAAEAGPGLHSSGPASTTAAYGEEGTTPQVYTGALGETGAPSHIAPAPVPIPKPNLADLSPTQLQAAWDALADPQQSKQAVNTLVGARLAVAFLKERLPPAVDADDAKIAELIAQLDDPGFPVRQKAAETLEKIGTPAQPALKRVLAGKPTLDMRRRVEGILDRLPGLNSRITGALEVLVLQGTLDGLGLVVSLANGPKEAGLTAQAKTALGSVGADCWNGRARRLGLYALATPVPSGGPAIQPILPPAQ